MSMNNRKDQHFIVPHRSTEIFGSVNQGSTRWQDAEWFLDRMKFH